MRLSVKERRVAAMKSFLDSRDFYEIAQAYRHSPATSPQVVVDAYEALKQSVIDTLQVIR